MATKQGATVVTSNNVLWLVSLAKKRFIQQTIVGVGWFVVIVHHKYSRARNHLYRRE
jgi:hypothetical protein